METNSKEVKREKVGRFEVGKAYVYRDSFGGDKYYLQRDSDVLMVNTSVDLINVHEMEKLVDNEQRWGEKIEEVKVDEFKNVIRNTIFNLGIYEFVKE